MSIEIGSQVVAALESVGISHVVWLPDSALGAWETALVSSQRLRLVRVCREGEAWALAAGLHLGGARPLVVMQNTGFFESGDSMRNALFDLGLPLYAIVGYRSFLLAPAPGEPPADANEPPARRSRDSACRFTEPVLAAWGVRHVLLTKPDDLHLFTAHYRECQQARQAGIALWAEGKG